MSHQFQAEVTLFRRHGLGDSDVPRGDGYSPYLVLPGCSDPVAVRLTDFAGQWDKPATVTVMVYHGASLAGINLRPGVSFEMVMGKQTVGTGKILSAPQWKPD